MICYSYANVLRGVNKPNAPAPMCPSPPTAPPLPPFLLEPSVSSTYTKTVSEQRYKQYVQNRLNDEIKSLDQKGHHASIKVAAADLHNLLHQVNAEIRMCVSGSFASRVDLPGSDLDVTVMLPDCFKSWSKFVTLMNLKKEMEVQNSRNNMGFLKLYVTKARVPVMTMIHKNTNTAIDIVYHSDDGLRNAEFLYYYSQVDSRFSLLCKTVKYWANYHGLINAKLGRLNSFTVCLMVVHYLQAGVSPAVLPVLHRELPELFVEREDYIESFLKMDAAEILKSKGYRGSENNDDVATLFLGFLKYYSNFKFDKFWISVREGKKILKSDKTQSPINSKYITVQDPFTNWNCGYSVWNVEIYRRIRYEFRIGFKNCMKEASVFTCGNISLRRKMIEEEGEKNDLDFTKWQIELEIKGCRARIFYSYRPASLFWDTSSIRMHRTKKEDTREIWPRPDRINDFASLECCVG